MIAHIFEGILLHHTVEHQRISQAAVLVGLDDDVGRDAASVAYDAAAGGLEFVRQRVGDVSHGAVFIAVRIVNRLHAAAAGGVVLGRSEFQLPAVRQGTNALHKALAEGASADDDGPVEVLEGAGHDF